MHLLDKEGKPVKIGEDKAGNPVTLAPVWSVRRRRRRVSLPGLREKRPVAAALARGLSMRPGHRGRRRAPVPASATASEEPVCCFPYFKRTPAEAEAGDATAWAVGQPARCCASARTKNARKLLKDTPSSRPCRSWAACSAASARPSNSPTKALLKKKDGTL